MIRARYVDENRTRREGVSLPPNQIHRNSIDFLKSWLLHVGCQAPILLVIHGSNEELRDPFQNAGAHGFQNDEKVLTYITRRVCEDGGRVIVFSGGTPSADIEEMKRILIQNSYVEDIHFTIRPAIDPIREIDWDTIAATQDFPSDWEVSSIFESRQHLEFLPALAILCQGYLAVYAQCKDPDDKDWNDQDIAPALSRMKWMDFMKKDEAGDLIRSDFGSEADKNLVRNVDWWRAVFGDDIEQDLKKEWEESNIEVIPESIQNLIEKIKHEEEIAPPKVVADAYLAICERLERQ